MCALPVASLPGLRPIPLLGPKLALMRLFADPLRVLPRLHREHGEIAATCRGDASLVCVFGPTYNKQVLPHAERFELSPDLPIPIPAGSSFARLSNNLTRLNGASHRRLRRLMMPAFSKAAIQGYRDDMVALVDAHLARHGPGAKVDLLTLTHELTLDVMSVCVFGESPVRSDAGLTKLASVFLDAMTSPATMMLPVNLPCLPFGRFMTRCEQLEARMHELMRARREAGLAGRRDAFSLLLAGGESERDPLSEDEVVANMVLLFLAGYETTANGLCAALMLLAQHPEECVALRAELDAKLGGAAPSLAQLAELPRLAAVVDESLRILPPSYITFMRRSTTACELGPHHIPAGATIALSPLITHHMPSVWPEPARFSPQRWLERRATPFEFMPFGGGTRRCIGASFSEQELRIALAMIVQRFALSLRPGQRIELHTRGITLGAKGQVHAQLLPVREQPRAAADIGGNIRDWVDWAS